MTTLCIQPLPTNSTLLEVRNHFPILAANPHTVFFDNAATAQKPLAVIEKIEEFNRTICANAGRGAYSWSTRLSREVEATRLKVANFINSAPEQVAFTQGATESLNMVAMMWGLQNLQDGDEIMLCPDDHASSILPWYNVQHLLSLRNIDVKIVPFAIHSTGTYDRKSFARALSARTRIVSLTHIHHLYGMEMDLHELLAQVPESVLVSLDASQSISHTRVDCTELRADFVSFSGHKMFAANGVGVLWASRRAMAQMWPMRVGAKTKLCPGSTFDVERDSLSNLVENGTLNIPSILSMKEAVGFIESIGTDEIGEHISNLTRILLAKLQKVEGLEFAPGIGACDCTKGFGILSFKINGLASADIGAYLDSENIFVKTGDQCLGNREDSNDYIRVSMQVYNTAEEIERFVEVLNEAIDS